MKPEYAIYDTPFLVYHSTMSGEHDSVLWMDIYNMINCDLSECKEKMFFVKNPDHEYKQLFDLR